MNSPDDAPPLEVYLLGRIDFDAAMRLQRRLVYDLGERGGGALVLCEHPTTLSVGRSGSRAHIRPDDEALRSWGIATRWVNRGGGCLLHLPGQLAAYLVVPLRPLGLDLQGHLDRVRSAIVGVLGEFDLKGNAGPDGSGVLLGGARVATVGVAVNRWIAYHGFTINVGTFLGPFEALLDEPGRVRQTSMEAVRQRPTPMAKVREATIRQVEAAFGLDRHHLYTDHPLIRRGTAAHAHAQIAR